MLHNVIVLLIKLYAYVGLNCNNWIIRHGVESVKKRQKLCWPIHSLLFSQHLQYSVKLF